MTFTTSPDRELILNADGHVLVTGGPGSGKTTVALRKALLRIEEGLLPEQKVLFLSFSRAAVTRIVQAARQDVPKDSRRYLEIQTFHSFFWQLVQGHGYLLGAVSPIRLLPPHDERSMRKGAIDNNPEWDAECERLFFDEGRIVFDLFAPKALAILQRSNAHRKLLADRYPLIIVDEAQDTGTEQWACIELLEGLTQLICLADLDQQIYDFRRDVSPERLQQIMTALNPLEVDLGIQNNRSPNAEIVKFANDILARNPRGSLYQGVSQKYIRPDIANRDSTIRRAIGILRKDIIASTGKSPQSIAYLTNWGKGVNIIAKALQGGKGIKSIPHRVVMDEAEVLLATRVIAFCLEPIADIWTSLATCLDLIAELYRARGKSSNINKAEQLARNATKARNKSESGSAKCPCALKAILEHIQANSFSGNPGQDWLTVRQLFEQTGVTELRFIADKVIYLIGFNRGRRIADALAEIWLRRGKYEHARSIIETVITEDQIIGSDNDLTGINVMTMHKSKGKEFDGVIILHLGNSISPFSPDKEQSPHTKSRKLLRVAITRARQHVLLLTDAYSKSPLLAGHRL